MGINAQTELSQRVPMLYVGSTPVVRIYAGSTFIWPDPWDDMWDEVIYVKYTDTWRDVWTVKDQANQ